MYHDIIPDPRPHPPIPLQGVGPLPEGVAPSAEDRESILEIAARYPRFGPQRIFSELSLAELKIPVDVVRVVLAEIGR